jgi:hypothetical protein
MLTIAPAAPIPARKTRRDKDMNISSIPERPRTGFRLRLPL